MLPVLFETGPSAHNALFHYRDDCPGHCANPNATHVSSGAHCVRTPFTQSSQTHLHLCAAARHVSSRLPEGLCMDCRAKPLSS